MDDFSVEGTLFLYDTAGDEVTVVTWEGQEASIPIAHLELFLDYYKNVARKDRKVLPNPPKAQRKK
jgi:hypothetical protein